CVKNSSLERIKKISQNLLKPPPQAGVLTEIMFSPPQTGDAAADFSMAGSAGPAAALSAAEQDVRWMQSVAQGDMDAFQSLIEAHQARVVGTVAKMLGDDVDSEDIAQQVFIRVWKSAGRYQP